MKSFNRILTLANVVAVILIFGYAIQSIGGRSISASDHSQFRSDDSAYWDSGSVAQPFTPQDQLNMEKDFEMRALLLKTTTAE